MNAHTAAIAVIIVLFVFSAVLALSETAFVRASRIRMLNLSEEGDKRADRILGLLEHPEQTLNSVLLVLLACQMVSATLLGTVLEPSFGSAGVAAGMVIEITIVFTFAEVAPKTFAVQHTDRAVLSVSALLVFLTKFRPLRLLTRGFIGLANIVLPGKGLRGGPFVTEEDLLTMADVAAQESSIETEERELIHSIFEFGDTVVREVMVPRPDMVAVDAEATVDEAIRIAISAGKSRLPAFNETTDDIIGLVFLKDLVTRSGSGEGNEPVRQMLRPAHFVARVETRRGVAARDAAAEVPHGRRRRRVRGHRRCGDDGRPARGDRRRDHRRVRRRRGAGRTAARAVRCGCPAAPRSTT